MSHVDEGTLHAYLDGELEAVQPGGTAALEAHIATCGECRARLEDERRIRDRSGAILGHAAPAELEVPPFDVVLQRARGNAGGGAASASRPRRSFTLPLAWAASIALALAGGWWARGMALAPRTTGGQAEAAVEAVMDVDDVAGTTVSGQPSVPGVAQAGSAARPATQAEGAAKPSVAVQPGTVAAAREPEAAVVAERVTTRERRALAGREADQPQVQVSAFAARTAADSGDVVTAEAKISASTVRPEAAPAPTAPAAGEVEWTAVDRAEAERRLGGRLLLIEELEVESIELANSGEGPLVRTRQAVAPGVTLVLLQQAVPRPVSSLRVAEEARSAPSVMTRSRVLYPAPTDVVVERNGFRVLLTADLPQDSLRALAERIR